MEGYANMAGGNQTAAYDKYKMFDSKEFNDIALGLFKMTLDSYIFGEGEEKANAASYVKEDLLENFKYLLDKTKSRDAEYYNELM